jgi:hypothetical protein
MNSPRRHTRSNRLYVMTGLVFVTCFAHVTATGQVSVITHHNNNYRDGWNSSEKVLTPEKVNATQFGLLTTVAVDDEVDAVPLVVPGVTITAGNYQGQHDVVYVETANNSVYAIDANAGTILLTTNLGTPVSEPLGCDNNAPEVGVNSTPVIDTTLNNLYLIAYTEGNTGPVYTVHALDLGNLTDKLTPQVVTGSHELTNGHNFVFNATYQRQRPALLEANGNIYAGFGSWCDHEMNLSRGWLLGWNAGTLAPLAGNQVFQTQATDPKNFFLASVWMSGWGPAADDSGNVLVITGNSDKSGTTYDGVTSIQESVIKVSADLTSVVDLFTPMNWPYLDEGDHDFGAGGIMVLPDQIGSIPHLATAAGKDGNMYFMNEDNLGGYSSTTNNVLGTYDIQKCYCGQSYFMYNKKPFVVTSGGDMLQTYELVTSPSPQLNLFSSVTVPSGQKEGDPAEPSGFFTSVSSNGVGNPIIWALPRPLSPKQTGITLYAFNPIVKNGSMVKLFSAAAGNWPYYTGNYNQIPVVANGKVYVASYQQLQIFGLLSAAKNKQ